MSETTATATPQTWETIVELVLNALAQLFGAYVNNQTAKTTALKVEDLVPGMVGMRAAYREGIPFLSAAGILSIVSKYFTYLEKIAADIKADQPEIDAVAAMLKQIYTLAQAVGVDVQSLIATVPTPPPVSK